MLGISSLGATWKIFFAHVSGVTYLVLFFSSSSSSSPSIPRIVGTPKEQSRRDRGRALAANPFSFRPDQYRAIGTPPPLPLPSHVPTSVPPPRRPTPPPLFWYFPSGPFFLLSGLYRKINEGGGHFQYQAQIAKASLPKTEIIKQVCNFVSVLTTSCSGKLSKEAF